MYKSVEAIQINFVSSFIQIIWPNVTIHMDKRFICVFAIFTIAILSPGIEGAGEGISLGIGVRQGELSSVITHKNGELLLNCSVEYEDELGPLSITWTKDGHLVDLSSKRVQVLANGSLYIRRVIHRPKKNRTDGGQYKCVATLAKAGTIIARDVQVLVAGIDRKFEIEPLPQLVPLGGVARFQCKIKAVPPAMYFWERNGTILPQNENRYLFLSSGILQITGVRESDVGRYKCYVTQGSLHRLPGIDIDTKYSSEATLDIDPFASSDQVKIVASSKNETAQVGGQALLECLVQGNVDVVWMKDKKILEPHPGIQRVGDNLLFMETELEDSGEYNCVADNVMVAMALTVLQKPVILGMEPESTLYPISKWIYVRCKVEGTPKPTIRWLKDGKDIPTKDKRFLLKKEDTLTIVFSDVELSGYYQCLATNEAGSSSGFTRLKIYRRGEDPQKPTNLTVINVTKSNITLVWNPAIPASPDQHIVAYTVHYFKNGDAESQNTVTQVPQIILKELSPFSEYSISVLAYTQNGGHGSLSEVLVVQTLEDVPMKPPTITVNAGSSSLHVTWSEMDRRARRGNVVGYKLYYRRKGEVQAREITIPGSAKDFEITGLDSKTEYELRLNAGTSSGYNSFPESKWPWVTAETIDDMHVLLSVDLVNATSINASWVCKNEPVWRQFSLQVRYLPSNEQVMFLKLPPTVRHHIISGLEENTIYEIILNAERLDGRKGQAVEEFQTSNVPLPPSPRSLHHTLITASSIGVAWIQSDSEMDITHFTVRYSSLGMESEEGAVAMIKSESNNALLERLYPFTQYRIAVQAHSVHTASQFSPALIVRTKEGVPSEPQNIHIQTVKPGHVNIEWSPPAKPNGQIKSYIIMYTSSLSDDEQQWIKIQKNGTEHSAIITITQTDGKPDTLYFKLLASTTEGPGKASSPIPVNTGKITLPVTDNNTGGNEQRTGIIIGISIGVFCIVICICVICCRHRILSSSFSQQPQTQPARFHGNGHIPGNGNGHAVGLSEPNPPVGVYELDAYTPMLEHLPENEDSDSKGGGSGNVILTPNGTKLNGFVPMKKNGIRNGTVQNGHMTPFLSNEYNGEKLGTEETRGLIASMLSGGDEHCMTVHDRDESFPTTRYEDLGSLDDIDRSSCEDVLSKTQEQASMGEEGEVETGSGNISASEGNTNPVNYTDSKPQSDTERDETVVSCRQPLPSVVCDGPTSTECLQGLVAGDESEKTLVSGNEIPHSPSTAVASTGSSQKCEDTYHDGGTHDGRTNDSHRMQACSRLPQLQLTTSTFSQARRSDDGIDRDTRSSSSSSSSINTMETSAETATNVNEPVPSEAHNNNNSSSSSNGFPAHMCCTRSTPQGDIRITSAQNNPTIPQQSSPTGEATLLSHGSGETTLETLAQIPQDTVCQAAKVNSSPWKHHYLV